MRSHLVVWIVSMCVSALGFGCAAGELPDAGIDGDFVDAGAGDSGGGVPDAGHDAGTDAGPPSMVGLCEICTTDEECGTGNFCAMMTTGERACVRGCEPDLPVCNVGFSCVLDFGSGVSSPVCLPVGEGCCIDEDEDEYGQGIGCIDTDCDDENAERNPGLTEICNGLDEDCDGVADNAPTDCDTGRCTEDGDGTYTSVAGGSCSAEMCETGSAGTLSDCGLFTCDEGGEDGTACAVICNPAGPDEDLYCISSAHCDDGACVPDVTPGGECDEDTDCGGGRCDNGFCCDSGTCCGVTADCPGGGSVTTLCETPSRCEGVRGMTTCNAEYRCEAISGIPDDSACDSTVEALTCAPYDPVYCDGGSDQPAPSCPTRCDVDDECIDTAHCEGNLCIPDRPPGGTCSGVTECEAGLFCVDGVCCTSECTGACRACDLTGSRGTCRNVTLAERDPDGECNGYSCAAYYAGFMGGSDSCFHRQDVSDDVAQCNGAGACIAPGTQCNMQPLGPEQINCDDLCQTPVAMTCENMMPGLCQNRDGMDPPIPCGTGICANSVQRCIGGELQTCTPLPADPDDVCNNLDDDCDGTIDNAPITELCTIPPGASPSDIICMGGYCQLDCTAPAWDLNGSYGDGCECMDDDYGNTCGTETNLGSIAPGSSVPYSGTIVPVGEVDWFRVDFPNVGRGPGDGNPTIALGPASVADFQINVRTTCGTNASCGTGSANGLATYSRQDNQDTTGAYLVNGVAWQSTIRFSISRRTTSTNCSNNDYTFVVSR